MRQSFLRSALLVVLLLCHGLLSVRAGDAIQGEAFSDPAYVASVPEGWLQQTIQYDENIGDADLVVSLGQQTHPALHLFVEELAEKRGLKIVVLQGTCGVSSHKLSRKAIDIGAFCCPAGLSDRFPGLKFHTIGIAPIALVVHPDNPLDDVTTTDARKIFMGDYLRWSDVPTTSRLAMLNKSIQPVARLHCKKRPGHWRLLLTHEDLFSPHVYEVGVIPDMINQVSENPAAIGYETLYMLEVHKKHGTLKTLSIDGNPPEDLTKLLSGEYPLYRTYSLTTWVGDAEKNKNALALVKDIKAHIEAHHEKYGFLPPSTLRTAGWMFNEQELIGAPDGTSALHEH